MRRRLILLVQSLGLPLVAGLFICALTGELRYQRLLLEWPQLVEPDADPRLEVLFLSLPSMLLFLLLARFTRSRALLAGGFVLLATLAAFFAALVFAQAFGSTWPLDELFLVLFLARLHLLALALLPGLLLLGLLEMARPNSP